ncbi:MAG TPA: energy transducer TonB [Kofleriaceae bacterium]|jgi:hypothetical protein|nr:energy transducer TonB [Kofleriaceae bacterium]
MRFRLHVLLAFGALISTAHADVAPLPPSLPLPQPPLPPPPPPPPPKTVPPQALQSLRIAGTMAIVPDDATKIAIARAGKPQTVISLKLCIATDGAINALRILKPSGFAAYDQKIVNTIQGEWKYKPYLDQGVPVPVCTAVTFIYSQQPADAPDPAAGSVKLVKPGAAPTRALRLVLHKGDKRTLVMLSQATRARGTKGKPGPTEPRPGMRIEVGLEVTDVAASGDAGVDLVYRKVESIAVPGAAPSAAPSAVPGADTPAGVAEMAGTKGHFTITARGRIKDFDLIVPPDATPQLRQMIDATRSTLPQLSDELPDQPVGVGAVWEAVRTITASELTVDVTTTRELTTVDGARLTIKVSQTQHGRGTGPGNLTTEAHGTGQVVLDLGKVLPARVSFDLQQDVELDSGATRLVQHETSAMTLTER